MPALSLAQLLDRLDELKRPTADAGARAQLQRVLRDLARRRLPDAASLIRLHESLLFLRAYPQSAPLLRACDKLLATFKQRVDAVRATDAADFESFSYSDVSGIAGTEFTAAFGYDITRWLAQAHTRAVTLVWARFEQLARLTATFPRFLPLFAESAYVDAHVPFQRWLSAAKKKHETELAWLMRQFDQLPLNGQEKAEIFEPMQLWVRWELGDSPPHARTRALRRARSFIIVRRCLVAAT